MQADTRQKAKKSKEREKGKGRRENKRINEGNMTRI